MCGIWADIICQLGDGWITDRGLSEDQWEEQSRSLLPVIPTQQCIKCVHLYDAQKGVAAYMMIFSSFFVTCLYLLPWLGVLIVAPSKCRRKRVRPGCCFVCYIGAIALEVGLGDGRVLDPLRGWV